MSPIRFAFPLALVTAVSLSLTACGGGDQDDASGQNTPAASTPAPSATAESPDASKTPAASVRRTSAELAKALLELADLPDGYQVEKDDPAGADKPFSSASSKCKTLVRFLNATEAPGAKATTHRSFSAGQEGTFVDFGIDAMGNEDEVAYLQHAYRKAVTSCPKVTMKIGAGRYSMKVEEISAPQFGTDPYAFRLTVTSGSRRGLEFTAATTGVQDVLVSVTLLAGQEGELEGATEAAVAKAQQVLKKGA
ncbi:hypothetical protein E1218_33885 [Kribbella turkmenica]|uniref:PknH-like extracellular domain-containing protein n=1 Tax=Kribbella turkmenica TaxID=2530375 RepID=A0A4R4WC94_9ACTN|nr:hypothetical protein [Kribbella turkmenica]TDD13893.1 hypothetical protein E1218_33885 [Kribbella turkmenica]